ncbi:MAG: hypothetical protein ABFD98_05000 [Syntrophobacteraceae bacterium]
MASKRKKEVFNTAESMMTPLDYDPLQYFDKEEIARVMAGEPPKKDPLDGIDLAALPQRPKRLAPESEQSNAENDPPFALGNAPPLAPELPPENDHGNDPGLSPGNEPGIDPPIDPGLHLENEPRLHPDVSSLIQIKTESNIPVLIPVEKLPNLAETKPKNAPRFDLPLPPGNDPPITPPFDPVSCAGRVFMTQQQYNVYDYLLSIKDRFTSKPEISENTGVLYSSVRQILKSLENQKILFRNKNTEQYQNRFGFFYKLSEIPKKSIVIKGSKAVRKTLLNESSEEIPGSKRGALGGAKPDFTSPPSVAVASQREELLLRASAISNEDIEALYPILYAAGVRSSHIDEGLKFWQKRGIDVKFLSDTLEAIEWDFQNHNKQCEIEKSVGGWLIDVFKKGYYAYAKDFIPARIRMERCWR